MAVVLLRVNVAYPKDCLELLRKEESKLKTSGMLAGTTSISTDSHNIVYFMFTWQSVESARKFWASSEGRNTIEKLPSVEKVETLILEDARQF